MADESTRLASFSYNNVAAAQAFIQSEKLRRVIRLTGHHRKDGQIPTANRAEQGITGCWRHFACSHQARDHNRSDNYQSDCRKHDHQPHIGPLPAVKTLILPRARDSVRALPRRYFASSCPALSRHTLPRHTKDRACRGAYVRVFQECLSLLADHRTYDFYFLASK